MKETKKLGKKGQQAFTISDLGTIAIALVIAVICKSAFFCIQKMKNPEKGLDLEKIH